MSAEMDAHIELMVQLRRIVNTVPDQAKVLLTSQPQLAYSLIQLMVKMNILSPEVLQKTLSSAAGALQPQVPAHPTPPPGPSQASAPQGILNGHPQHTPGFQHYPPPPPPQQFNSQLQAPTQLSAPAYATSPAPSTHIPPSAQAMLAAIPEDQKNMILQILSYTPEQISQLAPTDRATFVQLRATFGVGS